MKWIDDLPFSVFINKFSVILSRREEDGEMDRSAIQRLFQHFSIILSRWEEDNEMEG